MTWCTEQGRWSCPDCHRTVVVDAYSLADVHAAIAAVQERHGERHAAARRRAHDTQVRTATAYAAAREGARPR